MHASGSHAGRTADNRDPGAQGPRTADKAGTPEPTAQGRSLEPTCERTSRDAHKLDVACYRRAMRSPLLLTCAVSACAPSAGDFSAITYNVAGLPEGLSRSNPEANHPRIGVRINAFDLALVQEDFAYHDLLSTGAKHPYRSTPKEHEAFVGDGLNRFSVFPLGDLERHIWDACNGQFDSASDCLSEKGFSVGSVAIDDDVSIDVFNFHMDAGGSEDDDAARGVQIAQLLAEVATREGRAMILAGDTNLHTRDPLDVPRLAELEAAGLRCACEALACGEEHIDRFFFLDGTDVTLRPTRWYVPSNFLDDAGEPLSDHEPVAVDFAWELVD